MGSWNETSAPANDTAMLRVARGHVEQLPSGSFCAVVYAGVDPLTRQPVYLNATARTEKQAQVELGKLLGKACDPRLEWQQVADRALPTRPLMRLGCRGGVGLVRAAHGAV
jgi:hypothetical protein